ncbi:MAG: hypothetical protein J6U53_03640 [Tidjanibacter sp.]|nr:hypothetical protein [Tidjanibacter sp.]
MKRFLSITLACLSALSMSAQATLYWGGEVISPANMSHMEAAKYAQTDNAHLSARVAAMGGAFTSLGADLSSMAINPAGMGMYRTSQLSLSSEFDTTHSTNSTLSKVNSSNFSFNQLGAAMNVYQGSGALLSFTIGFAYNKLADLNFANSARWEGGAVTIGEFFAEQMYGINPADLGSTAAPFTSSAISTDQWGGVLAYRTYMIDPTFKNDQFMGSYFVGSIPDENLVNSNLLMESRGRVEEYDFSMGFNFGNILYLGTTLGITGIEQVINYNFFEEYVGAQTDEMSSMSFRPCVANYGSGVNVKIGAILRPVSFVRLGIAYHSPTMVSLTRDFSTTMKSSFVPNTAYQANSYINSYTYDYSSPSKLLLGASVSLADKAMISVDYDKVWYGGMRMNTNNYDMDWSFKNDVIADLGTADNFRVGVEVHPTKSLYLRGGYAYYGSPLNKEATHYNDNGGVFYGTYKTHSTNYSLGLGWRFASGSSLDLVWTLSKAHYTNSVMYDYYYTNGDEQIFVTGPSMQNITHSSNTIGLTYSVLLF